MEFVFLVVGLLIGFILAIIGARMMLAGTMFVYIPDTEDETPCAGFKWDRALDFISQRKYVIFKVNVRHVNSQE